MLVSSDPRLASSRPPPWAAHASVQSNMAGAAGWRSLGAMALVWNLGLHDPTLQAINTSYFSSTGTASLALDIATHTRPSASLLLHAHNPPEPPRYVKRPPMPPHSLPIAIRCPPAPHAAPRRRIAAAPERGAPAAPPRSSQPAFARDPASHKPAGVLCRPVQTCLTGGNRAPACFLTPLPRPLAETRAGVWNPKPADSPGHANAARSAQHAKPCSHPTGYPALT
jgi:hypothetical protein